jgi:hypothetical protein
MATQRFIGLLETLAEFACSRANRVSTIHPVFGFGCKRTRVPTKYPKINKRQNLKSKNYFLVQNHFLPTLSIMLITSSASTPNALGSNTISVYPVPYRPT